MASSRFSDGASGDFGVAVDDPSSTLEKSWKKKKML